MKHIKIFENFNKEHKVGSKEELYSRITSEEIDDILTTCGFYDEFPDLRFYKGDTSHSCGILSHSRNNENSDLTEDEAEYLTRHSFIIEIMEYSHPMNSRETLYHIEPKIWGIIEEFSNKLKSMYNLKVYMSDFGETDAYYEFLITDADYKYEPLKLSTKNESSYNADEYRYRRDEIIDKIKGVTDQFKTYALIPRVQFIDTPLRKLEICLNKNHNWTNNESINTSEIIHIFKYLFEFLEEENFELSQISYSNKIGFDNIKKSNNPNTTVTRYEKGNIDEVRCKIPNAQWYSEHEVISKGVKTYENPLDAMPKEFDNMTLDFKYIL